MFCVHTVLNIEDFEQRSPYAWVSKVQCLTVSYSVSQYGTVSHSKVQCLTVRYSVSQYGTVSHSKVQCLTVWYSVSQ